MFLIFDMDGVINDSAQLEINLIKITLNELDEIENELTDEQNLSGHPHDFLKIFCNDLHEAIIRQKYIHSILGKHIKKFISSVSAFLLPIKTPYLRHAS